jgi:hypothetical protein
MGEFRRRSCTEHFDWNYTFSADADGDEDSSQQSTTRRNMGPHETSANSAEIEAELMNLDELFNEFVDGDTDDEIVRDNMRPAIKDSDYAVLWQNASRQFDKTFYGTELGHICDIVRDNMDPAITDSDYAVLWQNASKHFDKTFYGNEFRHASLRQSNHYIK